jgi:hypothetical protein
MEMVMKLIRKSLVRTLLVPVLVALAAGSVFAQSASAPAAAASVPRQGPGMGPGMGGMGGMRGGRAGSDDTPGWGLMTRTERQEHRDKMRSMKTETECRDYLAKHHETMAARAKEKNVPLRGPKRDACAGLPK